MKIESNCIQLNRFCVKIFNSNGFLNQSDADLWQAPIAKAHIPESGIRDDTRLDTDILKSRASRVIAMDLLKGRASANPGREESVRSKKRRNTPRAERIPGEYHESELDRVQTDGAKPFQRFRPTGTPKKRQTHCDAERRFAHLYGEDY